MGIGKRIQIDSHLTPWTKLNSKWIKDFNIKPDALSLIEKKVGNSCKLICSGESFLNRMLLVQELRSTVNKGTSWHLEFSELQMTLSFQQSLQDGRFLSTTPNKELLSKIYKEQKQTKARTTAKLDVKNTNNLTLKQGTGLYREFPEKEPQMDRNT